MIKTLTFFSNYFNHHQRALCDSFYELLGDGFTFVETMPIEGFRADMGWGENGEIPYVIRTYESEELRSKALWLGLNSDLVLMGTAPEEYIEERLKTGKITFRYSERPLKEGFIKFFIPRLTKKYLHMHVRNRDRNIYVLGASAFTSLDYHKMFKSYEGKCYKWGYFPVHMEYDTKELIERKKSFSLKRGGCITILWLGRMLRLKRPDLVIKSLSELNKSGYDFRLTMVGEGEMRSECERLADSLGIGDKVTFRDFLSPMEARECMADHMIFVMTSNKLEGWGSVIYEALNAGCGVVASHACGATPWLVLQDKTGLVYKSGSVASLTSALKKYVSHPELIEQYGINAYENMHNMWNPKVAAKRMLKLGEDLESHPDKPSHIYSEGPCSYAEYLENNWFRE